MLGSALRRLRWERGAETDRFEGALEEVSGLRGGEVGLALGAGEGYEVQVVLALVTD